jgi:putative endonuclease
MKHYTYVLKTLKDGRVYKGMSSDVERRVKEHNSGQTKSTKGFIPWILVLKEEHASLEEAREREKYLKSGVGREYIKSLVL